MPIAAPDVYAEMLTRARDGSFAYPAVNVTSSQALHAVLRGFAEAESDGIVQVTIPGAEYLSGRTVEDAVVGATALARFAHEVADGYSVQVALHTDHCPPERLATFVHPLLDASLHRVRRGETPLFQSHMWDGSAVPLADNLAVAEGLLRRCTEARVVLELEVGVVAGEEDGVASGSADGRLYTTPDDAIAVWKALGLGEKGLYLVALTFGNVHGIRRPSDVELRPDILRRAQDAVAREAGMVDGANPLLLVFHGGSGSSPQDVSDAVDHGVVKMNMETDLQYAFTRAVAGHMFTHYEGVLKVDGGMGSKRAYDPRAWGAAGEAAMAARVVEACVALRSAGRRL